MAYFGGSHYVSKFIYQNVVWDFDDMRNNRGSYALAQRAQDNVNNGLPATFNDKRVCLALYVRA